MPPALGRKRNSPVRRIDNERRAPVRQCLRGGVEPDLVVRARIAGLRTNLNRLTFSLLYATDFADRLEREVVPALKAGYVVLASWLIKPLWPWTLVLHAVAQFALFGLLLFVISMLTKHDWLFLILIMVLCLFLRARWPAAKGGIGPVLNAVLPPVHLIGWDVLPAGSQWLWLAGWSLGLFLVGLAILRFRPIGES